MKLVIGIIIGILIILSIKQVYAGKNHQTWSDFNQLRNVVVEKIVDGNISCYISSGGFGTSISCVKVK